MAGVSARAFRLLGGAIGSDGWLSGETKRSRHRISLGTSCMRRLCLRRANTCWKRKCDNVANCRSRPSAVKLTTLLAGDKWQIDEVFYFRNFLRYSIPLVLWEAASERGERLVWPFQGIAEQTGATGRRPAVLA